jgi:hypothetical protein
VACPSCRHPRVGRFCARCGTPAKPPPDVREEPHDTNRPDVRTFYVRGASGPHDAARQPRIPKIGSTLAHRRCVRVTAYPLTASTARVVATYA